MFFLQDLLQLGDVGVACDPGWGAGQQLRGLSGVLPLQAGVVVPGLRVDLTGILRVLTNTIVMTKNSILTLRAR